MDAHNQFMDVTTFVSVIVAIIAVIGMIFGSFGYFNKQLEAVRKEGLGAVATQAALDSKARHDSHNVATTVSLRLESDIERLKRETVRRDELTSLEARVKEGQNRIEAKVDKVDEKLDRIITNQSNVKPPRE